MIAENALLDRDGWMNINQGFIGADSLRRWIKDYFNIDENINNFERRNEGYLELRSLDKPRGYTFVGELQLDRDYERRMRRIKEESYNGVFIAREFVDY